MPSDGKPNNLHPLQHGVYLDVVVLVMFEVLVLGWWWPLGSRGERFATTGGKRKVHLSCVVGDQLGGHSGILIHWNVRESYSV